jgi:hypothetical protein
MYSMVVLQGQVVANAGTNWCVFCQGKLGFRREAVFLFASFQATVFFSPGGQTVQMYVCWTGYML